MDAQSPDNYAAMRPNPIRNPQQELLEHAYWEKHDQANLLDLRIAWEVTLDFMLRSLGEEQGLDEWIGML